MPPINDPYAAFQIKGYCIFRIGAHKGEKFLEKFLSSVEGRKDGRKKLLAEVFMPLKGFNSCGVFRVPTRVSECLCRLR